MFRNSKLEHMLDKLSIQADEIVNAIGLLPSMEVLARELRWSDFQGAW